VQLFVNIGTVGLHMPNVGLCHKKAEVSTYGVGQVDIAAGFK